MANSTPFTSLHRQSLFLELAGRGEGVAADEVHERAKELGDSATLEAYYNLGRRMVHRGLLVSKKHGRKTLFKLGVDEDHQWLDEEHDIEFSLEGDPFVQSMKRRDDGSSLIDVNLAVGTIVGVHESEKITAPGSMVAAMYVIYGPLTTLVYAVKGGGVHEFVLNPAGEFTVAVTDVAPGTGLGSAQAPVEAMQYWGVGEGLFAVDADQNVIGKLATGWELAADQSYVDIMLRDDVVFHDDFGAFSADDVVFTLNDANANTNPPQIPRIQAGSPCLK